MADVNANIGVNIDASEALAQLKSLQRQISQFHSAVSKSSEAAALAQRDLQKNFINGVNSIGAFSAELRTVKTTAESFTDSLQKNKFSMREYFRYSMGATRTFGKLFSSELDTVQKVAIENVKRLQTQYIKMGRDASGAMKAIAIMPTQLDMTNLSTKTQLAAQRQAIFNQLVKQGSTNLLNFGKNTQWAGRQLMVGFTLPLMTLGSVATRTFMDMETAAIKFKKVYGDLFTPAEETQAALDNIEQLGLSFTKYGIAVSDTISLAAEAAAAGFQGVDLQRQTTEATRLQVLGQIDQQKALETTISLQNAFQMQSADLADAINFLNAVENQTVVSLDDITTAIPKAAPVVKQLGGDVKDLAFFMAAMKEGGINASEGANALKSGLASLINPTNKAKGMLADFGIDIDKIVNKNAGNVKATVIEFAKALDGLSDLNRQRAIEQLFGKFQLARLSTLFENVTKSGNQASRVLDLATASTQDLSIMAEKELGITADSAMNKFRASVEQLKASLAPVGQIFLEVVTPFIDKIGNVLDKFNELSPTAKKAVTRLVVILGGIAPALVMIIGLIANFAAQGIKFLNNLRNGFLRLTGQSQILGEQTQYLTTEQLDAAAAAHSLEQSHARLTQAFTIEAGAVAKLRKQYELALSAAGRFAMANPGMMMPGRRIKKYAKGIVSVPGPKGAGDIIPAMVSPGEAIIPTKMAEKYAPLINGMIADSIPGFRKGKFGGEEPGSGSSGRIGKSLSTVLIPYGKNVSAVGGAVNFTDINPGNMADITSIYAKQIAKTAKVSVAQINKEILAWKGANIRAIQQATNLVNQGESVEKAFGPLVTKFEKDMHSLQGPTQKFIQTARQKMPELQNDLIQAQQKAKEMSLNLKNAADSTKLASALPNNIVAQDLSKPGGYSALAKPRQAAAAVFGGTSGINRYGIPSFMLPQGLETSSRAYKLQTSQEHFSTTQVQEANKITQAKLREQARNNVKASIDAAKIEAQTASPSKKTIPIGQDIARGLQVGMADQIDETAKSGKALSNAAIGGTAGTVGAGRQRPLSQAQILAAQQGISLNQAKKRIARDARTPNVASKVGMREKVASRFAGRGRGAGFGASGLLYALSFLPGKLGEVASKASMAAFALSGLSFLPGPLKLVGAGLLATYGIIKLVNTAREKELKKLEDFGTATANTKKQLEGLSDYFNVPAVKSPLQSAGIAATKLPGERQAIEQFKASEQFKLFADVITTINKMSPEKAMAALRLRGLALIAQGYSKEMVQTIIDSILSESKQTTLKIDFKSIEIDDKTLATFGEDFAKGITNKKVLKDIQDAINYTTGRSLGSKITQSEFMGRIVKQMGEGQRKTLSESGESISSYLDTISNAYQNGIINVKQFKNMTSSAFGEIAKQAPNSTTQIILLNAAIANMEGPLAKSAAGINNIAAKTLVLQAAMLGVQGVSDQMLASLGKGRPEGFGPDIAKAQSEFDTAFNFIMKLIGLRQEEINKSVESSNQQNNLQDKKFSAFDKELTMLNKKRDALKEVNDELNRQNEYQQKQMDLINQSVQAKISGNYLQAAMLGQQSVALGAQYARESQELQMGKIIDITTAAKSAAEKRKKYSAADYKLRENITSGNYGAISPLAKTPNTGLNYPSGGVVYNFNMTANGIQDPKKFIDAAQEYAKRMANKNNKTNKVAL